MPMEQEALWATRGVLYSSCLANAEPSRRRERERCWFEFVVLKPVGLRRLVSSFFFFNVSIGFITQCQSLFLSSSVRKDDRPIQHYSIFWVLKM